MLCIAGAYVLFAAVFYGYLITTAIIDPYESDLKSRLEARQDVIIPVTFTA